MILAADASSAALLEGVEVNGGFGIIFDTEADTLSRTLGQKWAGHEDLLRKFHAEEEASVQRVQGGYRVVERPYVAVILSGTPGALVRLMPTAEGGLFPRFCFLGYLPDDPTEWRDMRPREDLPDLSDLLDREAGEVRRVWEALAARSSPLHIRLLGHHWDEHSLAFRDWKPKAFKKLGYEGNSLIHRAGLHVFRIAMVLSVWEAWEAGVDLSQVETIDVSDRAFHAALKLGLHYAHTGGIVLGAIPRGDHPSLSGKDAEFFGALPDEFTSEEAIALGVRILDRTDRTVYRRLKKWMKLGLITNQEGGVYRKV